MAEKTNKINFYLIKEGIELGEIFKDEISTLGKITVKDGFDLYYNPKQTIAASWVKDFFKAEFKENNHHIFNAASSQAVLVRTITIKQKEVTFAICFATGFHMLKKGSYESRFGLISVLNIVGENSLRRIDKHDISGTPKFTAEQLSKMGGQLDFGLNVELDILLGVTGTLCKDKKDPNYAREKRLQKIFGTTLSGKSNLNISAKFDIDNIDKLLRISFAAFNSLRYEDKGFAWIDKIELIKKGTPKHNQLSTKLDAELQAGNISGKMWLAVPELIEWQDVKGFYFNKNKENLSGDITFGDFKEAIEAPITLEKLKSTEVKALHSSGAKDAYVWSVYDCLYAEVDLDNESYILINSEWYKLKSDFVTETNAKYKAILDDHKPSITFKHFESSDKNENGYNKNLSAQISNSVCLDAENIMHGGGRSKIEFCDIFDIDNKQIIHIKNYSGSSVLSHLFAQGLVSAELLLNDISFRSKVEKKIKEVSGTDYNFTNNISDYSVVFGIIAKPNTTEIPFFSKVNLNNVFIRIKGMKGYKPAIAFIYNNTL